ncbi:disease resistance protein At4g27190-like [Camellia sinensis]|uniref:disease resistance protein At4g27190-like n=1 Tax=Camellia sinensis TaxID=4442 RepID=UPI00103656D5|nr:disease resistance protein At4g27190-like [Camellia sinensis]
MPNPWVREAGRDIVSNSKTDFRLFGGIGHTMENICSTIEIGKNLCDLTGPWVGYLNNLDTNMETLKRKTEQLNGRNNDINVEVNYAEQRSRKKRRVDVECWQEYVQRITADVQTLERQEQEVRGFKNAFKRAHLGKRVVDKIEEVEKLYENGEFSNGLLIDDPTCGHAIPTAESLVEPTSVRNREKIWNFLMDDAVRKIGVHGMGGIGKTTIMGSINNQLLSETSTFSDVIWVTVSKAFDIKNLQGQIAKKLNIALSDNEDELRSASEINKMLSQKKRYVFILDDLWKEFPLEKMGIPEPTRDNGCKLVLTTRLVDVCTKMNCRPVEMELLTEEEALNLFMNNVKEHQATLTTEVEEIAKEVAKKCARLPLAIVVMAGCMIGVNDIREWRNAKSVRWRLGKEGFFEQLEFSYRRLKDEQERHCFLYCALYPEDHDINREELIEYWIAEGLISEMNSIEAMFDEGHSILNKLIKTCLLVKSIIYGRECVKMHDLIRDMALKITSASPRFMVRAGEGLKRVPHKDWSEDLERVSLMWNHIEELPSEPPNCPCLITFLFRGNKSTELRIQNSFFLYMPRLKVLDLSDTNIESLPDSISMLENLHQLLLNACYELKNVPSLEKLKALEHFELTGSQIEKVPQGIGELVNLRKLGLWDNHNVKYVPSLEKLKALEHFELTVRQIEAAPQGIEELVNLRKLRLGGHHLKYVPSLEKLKALEHFELAGSQIEKVPQGIEELVNLRELRLRGNCNLKYVPSLEKLKALEHFELGQSQIEEAPQGIEELVNLRGLTLRENHNLKYVPSLEKLKALEHFELGQSQIEEAPQGIEELVNLRGLTLCENRNLKYVPSLEKLKALKHFELGQSQIEEAPQGIEELVNLRGLRLRENHNLKYVPSLEKLKALECFVLTHSQIEEVPQGIEELVNLRNLELSGYKLGMSPCRKLCRLTQLHSLEIQRTKVKVSAEELLCLKQLEVLEVQFHNVQELTMYVNSAQCKSLEMYSLEVGIVDEIKNERLTCEYEGGSLSSTGVDAVVLPSDIWKLYIRRWHNHISLSDIQSLRDARGLENFKIEECDGLESIFSSSSCFSEDYHIPLTTIEKLKFSNLPNFRVLFDRVVPPHNISFNLKRLVLRQCPKMENIFSALLLHNFPNLEKLKVRDCKNVEEIIVEVETSDRGGHREDDGDTITLPNLKILDLLNLPRLESIYKGIMVCESLQHISISNCPMLRRLPISLHKNEDGEQATAPPALRFIFVEEEWWESLEWDNPLTKTTLQPFCCPAFNS